MATDPTHVPGSLLLKGGRVIDPSTGVDRQADVAIRGDRVDRIDSGIGESGFDAVLDARDCIVAPGLIDPHVHLRDPGQAHKEDIATGTEAAVFGGFTTVCCMPNTSPALDTPEMLEVVAARAESKGHCRVFSVAAATKGRAGKELAEIALLARAGAVGFSDDGDVVEDASMMLRAMRAVKETGRAFMQHCQETSLTRGASMHQGEVSTRQGLVGWPRVAEELIVERDIRLAGETGCAYHVQHLSSAGSIEIVRRARERGLAVSAEASPHHLLLTHDACDNFNTMAKMNPPLREGRDVDAIREAIAEGWITVLATDHAPHTDEEKSRPFEAAPFGIIGLQTALPLYAKALVETGLIDWPRLIALMSIEPARLCRLDAQGLGALQAGGPADVTVIDPAKRWTIDRDAIPGRSKNTPFHGWDVVGAARATIVGGRIAFSAQA
jgi:dihydroorotase